MRIVILLGILMQIIIGKRNKILGAAIGSVITTLLLIWGLVAYSQGNAMALFSTVVSEPIFVLFCIGWFVYDAYCIVRAVKASQKVTGQNTGSNPADADGMNQSDYSVPGQRWSDSQGYRPDAQSPSGSASGDFQRSAHFSSRSIDEIECPICRKKQMSNRNSCFCCGCKFIYDDEAAMAPME